MTAKRSNSTMPRNDLSNDCAWYHFQSIPRQNFLNHYFISTAVNKVKNWLESVDGVKKRAPAAKLEKGVIGSGSLFCVELPAD